jgi:hypothetical protein
MSKQPKLDAEHLTVERLGGLAGFGMASAHIRSRGERAMASLSAAERQAVEDMFSARGNSQLTSSELTQTRDGFVYRISRVTRSGTEMVEVPEALVPPSISACVKDELI